MKEANLIISKSEPATGPVPDQTPEPHWLTAVRAARDKKATDIVVLDLTGVTTFTDYFIICSGSNARQVQAISDEIGLQLKHKHRDLPNSLEGYETAEWILADYGDYLIHVFSPKSREYFQLERLWREGKVVPLPPDLQADDPQPAEHQLSEPAPPE